MTKRFLILPGFLTILFAQQPFCTVDYPPIDEQSSIVKSQTYTDVFWVANDSDEDPVLFPLTGQGQIIIPDFMQKHYQKSQDSYPGIKLLGAVLHDWEAMALLGGDTLVIADAGNNGNARRDLGVYLVPEPNPHTSYQTRPLVWYPIRYPDQNHYPADEWEFDCEAIFTFKGQLYFLTKHRADQKINWPAPDTKLYRLDTRHTDRSNVLTYISRKNNLGGWVTDAAMAPDESAIVLLAQNPLTTTIWYFPRPRRKDDFLASAPLKYNLLQAHQAEGVCFKDSKTLIVTNEQRDWYEIPLAGFTK